jgi:hypothetical protein
VGILAQSPYQGEQMWPTIVTCQASTCIWNQYSEKTKVNSCTKLMILLNKEGICQEPSKYRIDKHEKEGQ